MILYKSQRDKVDYLSTKIKEGHLFHTNIPLGDGAFYIICALANRFRKRAFFYPPNPVIFQQCASVMARCKTKNLSLMFPPVHGWYIDKVGETYYFIPL